MQGKIAPNKSKLLSVYMRTDSFFYATTKDKKLSASTPDIWAASDYDQKIIVSGGLPFAHVPYADFNPLYLESYLSNLSIILESKDWLFNYDKSATQGFCTVYALKQENLKKIGSVPPSTEFKHVSTCLIDYCNRLNQNGLFVHVEDKVAHIIAINKLSFRYYNQISYANFQDLFYWIALSYDQLKLDRARIPLILSGNLHSNFEHYDELKKYIANIKFQTAPRIVGDRSSDFSQHLLAHIFTQCES